MSRALFCYIVMLPTTNSSGSAAEDVLSEPPRDYFDVKDGALYVFAETAREGERVRAWK